MVPCTIVIPTHSRDDLRVRAVCSALRACPPDDEVLVVDDKSLVPAVRGLAAETDVRLRVIVNTGPKEVSSTRNLGVACAAGEVIFFLDDDDEILPDYYARVLSPGGPVSQAGWGFSSTLECRGEQGRDVLRLREQLARGLVPRHTPVREAIAATRGGFWIHKAGFVETGGLDADQSIGEDTDLCTRLLARSCRPWYEPQPGVRPYQGYAPARPDSARLTSATPADRTLRCYRRTHDKNVWLSATPSAHRWFLATRYLRRAVRCGQRREARLFISAQSAWCFRFVLAGAVCFTKPLGMHDRIRVCSGAVYLPPFKQCLSARVLGGLWVVLLVKVGSF